MRDSWDWTVETAKAHLYGWQIADHLNMKHSDFSNLKTKMIEGAGLTASDLDKERWQAALQFISENQDKVSSEKVN